MIRCLSHIYLTFWVKYDTLRELFFFIRLMQAIDLFCGAGGMSIGASMSGIDVRYAIDLDPYSVATYKLNHPNTTVIQNDVSIIKASQFVTLEKKKPTVLFGGPHVRVFLLQIKKTVV